jgi:hypothetical protein
MTRETVYNHKDIMQKPRPWCGASAFAVLIAAGLALVPVLGGCEPGKGARERSGASESITEKCLNRICFEKTRQVKNALFRLSGISRMKYFGFDVYTAALYVVDREKSVEVLGPDAKILVIRYHREIGKEKVIQSIRRDLSSISSVNMREVLPRFIDLENAFEAPLKDDRYDFVFIPGRGMDMIRNGRSLANIPGDDFAEAFFGVWISPDVEDQKMRSELLSLAEIRPARSKINPVKGVIKVGAKTRESFEGLTRSAAKALKTCNPILLGKKTWRWFSDRHFPDPADREPDKQASAKTAAAR